MPLCRIAPAVGFCRNTSARPMVVLPEPDSPMMPNVSPRRTSKLTPSTAFTVARRSCVWNCTSRSRTETMVSACAAVRHGLRHRCAAISATGADGGVLQRAGQLELLESPAAHLAAAAGIEQFLLGLAAGRRVAAARLEAAAVRHFGDRRHAAGDRGELAAARAQVRQRAQQAGGVGMQRPDQRLVHRRVLDHFAGIHGDHAGAGLGHHAEVVGDQHQRGLAR